VTREIEVSELSPSSAPNTAPARRYRLPNTRNLSSVAGIAGTILLHTLALPSLMWATSTHRPHAKNPDGAGADRTAPIAPAEALVLITLANNAKPDVDPLGGVSLPQFRAEKIDLAAIDPPPTVSFETADDLPAEVPQATVDVGDSTEHALMFGRYMGQIRARIERAWMKPHSTAREAQSASAVVTGEAKGAFDEDQAFRCRVQIRQDARGNVEEVLLLRCNGTEAWRHSLVVAINQASPLPAPPTPKVFTRAVTMRFEGDATGPGGAADAPVFEDR
jgi:hypothetical protein